MAQREEEPYAQRALSLLQHEAHGVIDRRDVIRIESMAQTEQVGDEAETNQRGILGCEM